MKNKLTVLGCSLILVLLSGCGYGEVSSKPVNTAPTKIGNYTITYLGTVNVNGNEREVIEVSNTKTEETTLMIRGFGTTDIYTTGSGKHRKTHED